MWAAQHCSRLFSSTMNRLCVFTRLVENRLNNGPQTSSSSSNPKGLILSKPFLNCTKKMFILHFVYQYPPKFVRTVEAESRNTQLRVLTAVVLVQHYGIGSN